MDSILAKSGYPRIKDRYPYTRMRALGIFNAPQQVQPVATTTTTTTPMPAVSGFEFFAFNDQREFAGPGYDTYQYFAGAVSAVAALNPNTFSVIVGDMDPVSSTNWTMSKYLGSAYPWFPVVGNHEAEHFYDMDFIHTMNASGNTLPYIVNVGPSGGVETSYSFDYGNCHFVVINNYYAGEDAYVWPLGLLYVNDDQTQYGGWAYEVACGGYIPVPVSGYPSCVYVQIEGGAHPPYGTHVSMGTSLPFGQASYSYHGLDGIGGWYYDYTSSPNHSYTLRTPLSPPWPLTKARDANNFGYAPGSYWYGNVNNTLFNWLSADLASTTQDHIFVFGHEPAYPQPDMDTGWSNHIGNALDKPGTSAYRDRFWALLTAYGVDIYFNGHTHAASFLQPITASGYPYQLDTGHARGIGQINPPSTFVRIGVSGADIKCDYYRYNAGNYLLTHTFTISS